MAQPQDRPGLGTRPPCVIPGHGSWGTLSELSQLYAQGWALSRQRWEPWTPHTTCWQPSDEGMVMSDE